MNLVVGLVLVVALTTLVKLGTRRLFRGRARPAPRPETRAAAIRKGKPEPTARTNGRSQRRR